jgi:murein L,D-transpeptidase YafK
MFSVGKLGTDKWQEGDQRTPLGIYFVGRHIPDPVCRSSMARRAHGELSQ